MSIEEGNAAGDYSSVALFEFLAANGHGQLRPIHARNMEKVCRYVLLALPAEDQTDIRLADVDRLFVGFAEGAGSRLASSTLTCYASLFRSALRHFLDRPRGPVQGIVEAGRFDDPSLLIPVALRKDVIVWIQGLPVDLTEEEADRLSRIIRAHCSPSIVPVATDLSRSNPL